MKAFVVDENILKQDNPAMRHLKTRFQCLATVLLFSFVQPGALLASKKKAVPPAPMPAAIADAKKAFVTNAGGSQLAFDEFYSQVKQWGRFQLVGSPEGADIILELRYFVEDKGTRVSSSQTPTPVRLRSIATK